MKSTIAAIGMERRTPTTPKILPRIMMETRIRTEEIPRESPKSFGFRI